jgi:hypothetical protein
MLGTAAIAVAALLVATLCGGALAARAATTSIASESPSAIVAAATSAIDGVSTARVTGSGLDGTTSVALDLMLVAGKGGEGNVTESGLSFQFVVIGGEGYFKAGAAFWKHFANQAVAQLAQGKWFKAPASGSFAGLAQFGNLHALFTGLLAPHGTLTKGAITTVRGQKVIPITSSANGGTLYVAATGKPYPVEIADPRQHGVIVVDDINQPVKLTAPSGAIDLSQLTG